MILFSNSLVQNSECVFRSLVSSCIFSQKEAKIDKPMTDGRTALIKAVENDDRAMVETLLNANLLDNFSDRSSFSYGMADTYQRPDRGK